MTKNKHTTFSREEIETYLSTKDNKKKHLLEKKSLDNDFDNDALEGWSESNVGIEAMTKLDKKFRSRAYAKFWIFGSIAIIAIGVSVLFYNRPTTRTEKPTITSSTNKDEILIEKTDIVIPEKIEAMQELPKKEQIKVKTIVTDFSEKREEEKTTAEPIKIDKLEPRKEEEPRVEPEIVRQLVFGKEIYLHDLKLLDYREYRSKPTIETKQLVLTGTPANLDNAESAEEEPEWRTVDIPYMEYLSKSMEIFSKGQNKKALARFQVILDTYSDDVNANFYAGLCYFNLKEYDLAINSFEKCYSSKYTNFNEEAEWYLAKSHLSAGKKTEAKALFNRIVERKGYYEQQAKKILSTLQN